MFSKLFHEIRFTHVMHAGGNLLKASTRLKK